MSNSKFNVTYHSASLAIYYCIKKIYKTAKYPAEKFVYHFINKQRKKNFHYTRLEHQSSCSQMRSTSLSTCSATAGLAATSQVIFSFLRVSQRSLEKNDLSLSLIFSPCHKSARAMLKIQTNKESYLAPNQVIKTKCNIVTFNVVVWNKKKVNVHYFFIFIKVLPHPSHPP